MDDTTSYFSKESYITDYLVIRVQRSFAQGFSVLFNGIGTENFLFYCKIEICMYKSSIFLRSIINIIFLNRQLSVVHTVELDCYRAFVRKRILNYFRLIKRRPLLWNQNGLQITPSPPPPAANTHCGSQYVAAEPGRARRQRCYYIMKHAAQAQGRGVGGGRGRGGSGGGWRHSRCGGGDRGGCPSGEGASQPCGLRR